MSENKSNWRDEVESRLRELKNLDKGWDGYDALPVNQGVANFAMSLLNSACLPCHPAPKIVPGIAGDLQLEWHNKKGDIELHVLAPNKVDAWCLINNIEKEVEFTTEFSQISAWLKELIKEESVASERALNR